LVASILLAAPPAALAHGGPVSTVQSHLDEDFVGLDRSEERRLERQTTAATAADAEAAAAAAAGDEGDVGSWGPVVDWPVVGVHVALLENGKVLAYDSVGDNPTESYEVHDFTRATVWNPSTGAQTPANVTTGFNIFCSGLAHLMSGSLFIAGGNLNANFDGLVQTHVFNSNNNSWTLGPNMEDGRWYPTVTPLRNGEELITSGHPTIPEVRTTGGGLRALNNASLNLPLYPWIDVAPDGRAFYSGPDETLRSLNTSGGGSWQSYGQRDAINRDYGGHVLYDIGKILVAGGGPSTADARVIDINGATPQVSATDPMETGRRQFNLTVLADGKVLATGGNSSGGGLVDLSNGVYTAELWNPDTGQWRTLSSMQVTRQYHSTALLLPDGRVLSSGGGICGTCASVGYLAKNAEVFSPPYLFKKDGSGDLAPRPQITSAPDEVTYETPFSISTPNAGSISKVALVRLGAVTHSDNMEQRYIPLSFTAGGGAINATGPANANVAPPGVYMLFVIGAGGVPSVAEMVNVGEDTTPPNTTITSGPSGGTNDRTPTFGFSSSEAGSSFQCRVDSGSFATCSSPHTTAQLADGSHTFQVRATDAAGNTDSTPASRTFTVDGSAPQTTIDSGPAGLTSDRTPTFGFSSSEGGSSFECKLDSGSFAACASPHTTAELADGAHTLQVRATDAAGNTDATPDSRTFTVDATPPQTTISSGPSGTTHDPTPSYAFSSSEAGSSFQCSVDSGPFASCSSPNSAGPLADGPHSFRVRAVDPAGNVDPTPSQRSLTLDTASVKVSGSTLTVKAAVGTTDNLVIIRSGASSLVVSDLASAGYEGSGVNAGAGCTPEGDYAARCEAAGITLVDVKAGDQADKVTNSTSIRSALHGGPASDRLTGGSNRDSLTGGKGADSFRGMNGSDHLYARDLASDVARTGAKAALTRSVTIDLSSARRSRLFKGMTRGDRLFARGSSSEITIHCDGGDSPASHDKVELDKLPKDPDSVIRGCETKTRR
jgi:hypothetical protein